MTSKRVSRKAAEAEQPEEQTAPPAETSTKAPKRRSAAKPAAAESAAEAKAPEKKTAPKATKKAAKKAVKAAPKKAAAKKPAAKKATKAVANANLQDEAPEAAAPPKAKASAQAAPPKAAAEEVLTPRTRVVKTGRRQAEAAPAPEPATPQAPREERASAPEAAPARQPEAEPAPKLVEPDNPLPKIKLEELPPLLREAAARAGWSKLTHVQEASIPYMLEGRDMMIQSRTGSGKTGAFVLPILDRIDPALNACQALILVPTRELAQQVAGESLRLAGGSGIRTLAVYGGTAYGPQLDALAEGAHIVVGTPGRILDHLLRRTLTLDDVRTLVFDEADRMLSMGFYPDMKEIDRWLPRKRDGFMFSATYPLSVKRLAGQFLKDPGTLSLSHEQVYVSETEQIYYEIPGIDKDRALVRIIEVENPESAIIFCNTKMRVNYVATVLKRFGYDVDQLTADLQQTARERVLERLRRHQLRFLVATDIAARGIDVVNLSHVINYEVPQEAEQFIHRTGRTGRAGASGEAITLVDFSERVEFKRLVVRFHLDMVKREPPTDEEVAQLVGERLTAQLEARLRGLDRLKAERMERFLPLVGELGQSEEGKRLLAMVLDEIYHKEQHAAPAVPPEEREARPQPQGGGQGGGQSDRGGEEGGSRRRRKRRRR